MLTPQQTQAIELLSSGLSSTKVAAELRVTKKTLSTWKHDEEYTEALSAAIDDKIGALRTELKRAGLKAVEVLLVVMETGDHDSARVRAAEIILRYQVGLESNEAPQISVLVPELREKLPPGAIAERIKDANNP